MTSTNKPAVLLRTVVAAASIGCASAANDDTTRAMREIFDSMRYLLPLSVEERWQDRDQAELTRRALQTMAHSSSSLATHARSDQHQFRFLGRTLAQDLSDVLRHFERAEFDSARYLLLRATDYCVACHVRLPAHMDSPLSAQFVDSTALARLPLAQRAHLQLAIRRFDDALASFEALFAAHDADASLFPGYVIDYLVVSVRVRQDLERALTTLDKLAMRRDLWPGLATDLRHWQEALRGFRATLLAHPTLALGADLMEQAAQRARFLTDRRSLVHYVLASAVLHRVVESSPPRSELARAYYFLGLSEYRIGRDFWIAQGEMFLESAIRLAPASPTAVDAYTLLEQEILAGYTGSAGLNLPEDERRRLDDLRTLIETPHQPTLDRASPL